MSAEHEELKREIERLRSRVGELERRRPTRAALAKRLERVEEHLRVFTKNAPIALRFSIGR